MSEIKVFISPQTKQDKPATGGIARVVEAQQRWLPEYGIEVVDSADAADILALHATNWISSVKPEQLIVSHCHGLYWSGYDWHSKWYGAVNHQVIESMRQADAVTCPSEWVANSIRRGTQLQVNVIGHGVDIEDWTPSREHSGYIYWDKSRVDPICDPKAVNVLAQMMPNMKFRTTFGDETSNVQVVGARSYQENKQLMAGSMLYLATARETFGISVLEALACGVPVVGWDWAGQAEIMKGYKVGMLVQPGDYEMLAKAVDYCILNRGAMSQAARQLIESEYQWKHVVKQYAELYESLMISSKHEVKVSVIMPSYNLRTYLPQAIESVLSQDIPVTDYELIIVDDCSTDGSYDIASEYLPTRHEGHEHKLLYMSGNTQVSVYRTPQNLYLAGALNYGIERAKGKYIVPLDADNMLAPGALQTLAGELDKDRSLDIAYGKVKFITQNGSPDLQVTTDGISSWPPKEFSYDGQMSHHNQIPSTSMYRKKIWERVGGYRQRCRTAEDADFWCRATSFGAKAARVTDAVCLIYRNREDSMSHTVESWPWEAWYSWAYEPRLTPYAASMYREGLAVPIFQPKVSVIIPVGLGHEHQGLQDALDSLQSQTYQDWEAIVVNDTGQDLPWIPSWARIVATSNRASGASVARNLGIKDAVGDYIVFLDADDYLDPSFLAKTLKAAYQNPEHYIYTDFQKPETGEIVAIDPFECQDQLHNLHHPITCLYPRQAVLVHGFDPGRIVGEDWDFVLGVLSAGYCGVRVAEPLVYYRQVSGSNRKGLKDNIAEIRRELNLKWEAKMAGCGCGNKIAQPSSSPSDLIMAQQGNSGGSDLVLMQFVQPDTPTQTWNGPVTGQQYRFGSGAGHNVGYVHRSDAERFAGRPEFEVVDPSTSNLAFV